MKVTGDEVNLSKRQARKQNKLQKVQAFVKLALANSDDRLEHMKLTQKSSPDSETASEEDGPCKSKRIKLERNPEDAPVEVTDIQSERDESEPKTNTEMAVMKREKNIAMLDLFLLQNEDLEKKRREVIERRKLILQLPTIRLLETGFQAKPKLDGIPCQQPLKPLDVMCLLRKLVKPHDNVYSPKWIKLDRPGRVVRTVMVLADGVSTKDVQAHRELMPRTEKIIETMVEVKPNLRQSLVHIIMSMANDFAKCESSVYESETTDGTNPVNGEEKSSESGNVCERTSLLLSLDQMERDNYPFIKECQSDSKYVCTKKKYAEVTNLSPLFGIDCEMCDTSAGKELTRVAIVNENFDLIYDEYVKPDNEITDYLTCYSGITAECLSGVTTRLEDVQKKIRKLLPPDAILCGHSLNSDLHALKMVHPYNIDTSVIYRLSKYRRFKASLKYLAKMFLNQDIQMGRKGHNPVEDGTATLRLVLLKLQNGIDFGDASLCRDYEMLNTDFYATEVKLRKQIMGFLHTFNKSVKLITSDASTVLVHSSNCSSSVVPSNKVVTEQTCKEINEHDFLIAHMKLKTNEEALSDIDYKNLDKRVKKIFECSAPGTLFFVLFDNSSSSDLTEIENSLLVTKIKSIQT